MPIITPTAASRGASTDHDAKGRFVKGNKGGPGNPLAGKVNQVRSAFLECFDRQAMYVLCDYLFRKAMSGDPRFMRIILQYTVGKLPTDDAAEAHAFQAAQAAAEAAAELADEFEQDDNDEAPEEEAPDGESPTATPQSAVRREEHRVDPKAAGSSSGQLAGTEQISATPPLVVPLTTPLGAGVADLASAPHSKNRERLLKLLDERDPLRPDSWAGPPSTNGLGEARHIPLVGT